MSTNTLRRITYRRQFSARDDSTFELVVTRERNGDGVFRLEGDATPVLVGWSFVAYCAVEAVLQGMVEHRPSDHQDIRIRGGSEKCGAIAVESIVFEREVRNETKLTVTREANGYLLTCSTRTDDLPFVYSMHADSTSAIEALHARARNHWLGIR